MSAPAGKIRLVVLLWVCMIALVVWGELLPGSSAPMRWIGAAHISDKLLHFIAYTLTAFLPVIAFGPRGGAIAGVFVIALGVLLEYLQMLVPGRSFDTHDMLANAVGVLAGLLLGISLQPTPEPQE